MKDDRSSTKPRGKPGGAASRSGPRKPARAAFGAAGARKPPRAFGDGGARKPTRTFAEPGARKPRSFVEPGARRPAPQGLAPRARPPRPDRAADPYQAARRPPRDFSARPEGDDRFARGERGRPAERTHGDRGGRGFTVTLDPDVARVFRGEASVNRALRLVLQLMQVVQGPPPRRDETPRGYQGTPEARGFTRQPRFEESDETPEESTE